MESDWFVQSLWAGCAIGVGSSLGSVFVVWDVMGPETQVSVHAHLPGALQQRCSNCLFIDLFGEFGLPIPGPQPSVQA